VVQDTQSGFSFVAADQPSVAGKRLSSITTGNCFPKTRVRGFRRRASGRLSLVAAQSPGFTPGWRTCAYKTVSGRREWPNRDPLGDRAFRSRIGYVQTAKRRSKTELTLYSFVSNNALSRFDPLGLSQGILGIPGTGGRCCNRTSKPEFWIDDGVWKPLPPGTCTGFRDDCDGYTCEGGFYTVHDLGSGSCTPNDQSLNNLNRRWTPTCPGPYATPPGPEYPGGPGGRGGPVGNPPPPGYRWATM
jgi:hypothetical protein